MLRLVWLLSNTKDVNVDCSHYSVFTQSAFEPCSPQTVYQCVVVQRSGNLVFDWDYCKHRKSVVCHDWAQDILD